MEIVDPAMEQSRVAASRPAGPTASSELLERERQLDRIRQLLSVAGEGRGALAAIVGAPGEGKTALLGETCRIAAAAGFRVWRARGSELEREFAFGAARQLLEPAARALDAESRRSLLQGAAGLAAGVLDIDAVARAPQQSFAALHGLYWLLAGLSESGPVLLALDDAHWADRATLGWLAYLRSRIDDLAVLVVIATREIDPETADEPLQAIIGDPRRELMRVGALGQAAIGTLAERALGATPDGRFVASLHRVTGGNPFAVQELLKELARADAAPTATAAADLGARAPEALQRDILTRIGRLPPASWVAAQALAVLGDRAAPRHVATLGELDLETNARALDTLAREGTLARGPALAFVHPLVRTAVYDALPARRRARLHARAAGILGEHGADPEAVAAHLLLSDPEGRAESVHSLREAAVAAVRRGAPSAGVTYLSRALSEPPTATDRASLLAELAHAEALVRSPAALGHIHEALGSSEDPVQRARLRWLLSDVLFFAGEWDSALKQLEQALGELGERELDLTLRLEGRLLTLDTLDARAAETARAAAECRLSDLRQHARLELAGARPLCLNLALLLARGSHPPAEVLPLIERGLDEGRFLERETSDAVEAVHAAFSLILLDRINDATAFTDAMLLDAAARGSVLGFLAGSTFRALANLRRGALAEAEADALPSLELAREQELHFTVPFTAGYLALIMCERGRVEQAAELLATIPLPAALAGTPAGVTLLEARGRVQRARGDLQRAVEDLQACGAACEVIGVANPNIAPWRSELALALRDSEPERARELVALELELARRADVPRGIGVALRAGAVLAPTAEREALLADAVATLERSSAPLELARALIDLGAHLRRQGQRVRAREPLRRGLEIANRSRAEPLAELAREELRAAGARPRRPWLTGVDALTPSELRVARLVAAGRSNAEVAQLLFITTQTVKGHLSSAYRKLDIGSRRELADALARQSSADAPA